MGTGLSVNTEIARTASREGYLLNFVVNVRRVTDFQLSKLVLVFADSLFFDASRNKLAINGVVLGRKVPIEIIDNTLSVHNLDRIEIKQLDRLEIGFEVETMRLAELAQEWLKNVLLFGYQHYDGCQCRQRRLIAWRQDSFVSSLTRALEREP
jgi:hypothetical protein